MKQILDSEKLAIHGGTPLRAKSLPYRRLFGEAELESVIQVFKESWENERDFGYQGKYEKTYADLFCRFQGGGFADAVCSGTAAVYLALAALDLPPGSEVIVSPVTDPGSVSPVILLGMQPVSADSQPGSFNVGPNEFESAIGPNTRAAILTHLGGIPVDLDPILETAASRGIVIIEDCSQSHGAVYKKRKVGRFGAISAFSTMFSKAHATGGCGGVVYTESEGLYRRIRALADRGKDFDMPDFNPKDPGGFLFPALNLNLDELSCAIGASTLSRLQETVDRRREIVRKMSRLLSESQVVSPAGIPDFAAPSPFFMTLEVNCEKLTVSKQEFAEAVAAEGIWVNPDYRYVVSEWAWIREHLRKETLTPNAVQYRERTFNILFNERFSDEDIRDIVNAILKVEAAYLKGEG
ncbi:MAG: DegT/DnrJ/EryC1/StrS family aminotransferase [Armatimonadetes bacterium]|nr:DegT/DnrJ/EryC1/StrS family aminotransferase [Armatimonadota bacterium]